MKHRLRLPLALFTFISALLLTTFGYAADINITDRKFLNDTIITVPTDTSNYFTQTNTSNYLTLPILVQQDSVPMIPADLVRDRLSCLEKSIPLHYNRYVQGFVDYFTIRNRKYTRRILERENVYFPLFEKYLTKYNLPQELKYLSVVESALNPRAISWAKAVGLWQFMSPTAGDFNLRITPFVDERMDPEKSTEAACKFIKQLYRIFGDWELVMAAYNCGAGNVKKAIARSGGKKSFWEIFPYLPKETRSYVPSFTAVVYTMHHATEHEIVPDTLLFPVATDTLLINQSLDLSKLALQLSLPSDELHKLNPAVRKGILPETIRNYPLKVPQQVRETLALNRVAILDSCRLPVIIQPEPTIMLASSTTVKNTPALTPAARTDSAGSAADSATAGLQQVEYKVVRGDFLQKIAQKNKVSITQLKAWNKLTNGSLRAGQKLVIYVPAPDTKLIAEVKPAEPEIIEKAPVVTVAENSKTAKDIASINYQRKAAKAKKLVQEVKLIHAVQPGDTLWNISKRYNNIPVEQIKKLNKLKTNEIKPGQKLVIS